MNFVNEVDFLKTVNSVIIFQLAVRSNTCKCYLCFAGFRGCYKIGDIAVPLMLLIFISWLGCYGYYHSNLISIRLGDNSVNVSSSRPFFSELHPYQCEALLTIEVT